MTSAFNPQKYFTAKRLIIFAAILTIGSMLVIASISYRTSEADIQSDNSSTAKVELIERVLARVKECQAAHREFLLTGNDSYLQDYDDARIGVDEEIVRLRSLLKQTDYSEVEAVNILRELIHGKLAEFGKTLDIRRNAGLEPAIRAIVRSDDANTLARITKLVEAIRSEEFHRQNEWARQIKSTAAFHQHLTIGLVGIDLLFLVAVGFLVVRITRLRNLVTVCAWSQKIEYEGRWLRFEEFLKQRFGIQISHGLSEDEFTKLVAETEMEGANIIRVGNFEPAADIQNPTVMKSIHAIRNHLTALFCVATVPMGSRQQDAEQVMTRAEEISNQINELELALRPDKKPAGATAHSGLL